MLFHDTTHTGELTSRMGSDVQELGLLLGNYFGTVIINLVQTLGSLGVFPSFFFQLLVNAVYLTYTYWLYSITLISYFCSSFL